MVVDVCIKTRGVSKTDCKEDGEGSDASLNAQNEFIGCRGAIGGGWLTVTGVNDNLKLVLSPTVLIRPLEFEWSLAIGEKLHAVAYRANVPDGWCTALRATALCPFFSKYALCLPHFAHL